MKQKIANGQWKPISDSNEKEPTEGFDLYTTIDVNIQDIAHNALLGQLEKFEAEILFACKKSCTTENIDSDFIRIDNDAFHQCPNESIDYAVMEHTKNGVVVPLDANWSDVGSWSSLWDVKTKDNNDNVSEGDVVCIVEAMKMMNEIKSEFSGKVLSINVENEQPVEYGQTLFKISK